MRTGTSSGHEQRRVNGAWPAPRSSPTALIKRMDAVGLDEEDDRQDTRGDDDELVAPDLRKLLAD